MGVPSFVWFAVGFFIGGVMFFCIGGNYSEKAWMKFAVYHHAGHYDGTTGNFVWNDDSSQIGK